MVTFLKGRRRDDTSLVAVDASGANIATVLEALVARAEAAAEQLRALQPVAEAAAELDAMHERASKVEQRLSGLEGLADRLKASEEQAARLADASEDITRIQAQMSTLTGQVDVALLLGEQIDKFLGLESPVAALRDESGALGEQLADLAEDVGRMRGQADDALQAHRHATSRLEAFDQEHQAAAGRLEDMERRVQAVGRALEPVDHAVTAVPELQHRLAVVKALADQVAQKTSLIEQQREAVDRASNQISKLTRLDRELDAWVRRQEEQIRRFGAIEAKVTEVQSLQVKVLARSEELQATAGEVEETQQAARQALTELREQMRKSSESFELENRGLHAVSERIADLRNAVKECEARFSVLDVASQGTAAVQVQVRALGDQAGELALELGRLLEESTRIGALRQEVERLDGVTGETATRVQRIEELRPEVEVAMGDLATLKGTRELMADGLEQMRRAYEEMGRLRESHGETQAWLADADQWTRKVQGQVKELGAMEPAVERIRGEVEQVKAAMTEIDSRRGAVEEVYRRLGDLGAISAELRERGEALRGRMDGAESRFTQLARQADEAQRVAETVAGVAASVGETERRLTLVDDSARVLEGRTRQLDELQERIRRLGEELDQRQGALDKATEHLAHASALRQESAQTAQRLEEVTRVVRATLGDAEERAGGLQRVSGELESRAAALRPIDRQLTQFEDLLGRWESAQAEAARALEQTLTRQAAVDALEAQVKYVFGLAERAVEDVQAIGGARREVMETRELLTETQAQFRATEDALQGFDVRTRQLERAEQRLARAEALALGLRSAVEALQAQRTVIDHALESAGALGFQMKQAEALITALRQERTLACELKASLAALGESDDDPR